MTEPNFKDILANLEAIQKWEMTTDTDNRILELIAQILNRLILLKVENIE